MLLLLLRRKQPSSPDLLSSLDAINLSRSRTDKQEENASNYDRLPSEMQSNVDRESPDQEIEFVKCRSGSVSPDIIPISSERITSPYLEDDGTDLPRSSPTVKVRSITPEHAQRIRRMGESLHKRSLTTSRVSSEGSVITQERQLKKAQTMKPRFKGKQHSDAYDSKNTYEVPQPIEEPDNTYQELHNIDSNNTYQMPSHPDFSGIVQKAKETDSATYSVPQPSLTSDFYQTPKCVLASPPNGKRIHRSSSSDTILYNVPREVVAAPNVEGISKRHTIQEEQIYKQPSSIPAPGFADESVGAYPQDVSPVPPAHVVGSETDGVYNVPRGNTGQVVGSRNTIYNVPSPAKPYQTTTPPSFSNFASVRNVEGYGHLKQTLPSTPSKLKTSRSFESLHRIRVNTAVNSGYSKVEDKKIAHTSARPPQGVYVDIDKVSRGAGGYMSVDQEKVPAKKAPLPPLPTTGTEPPPPAAAPGGESMYCEISDTDLANHRYKQKINQSPVNVKSAPFSDKYTGIERSQTVSVAQQPFERPKLPSPSPSSTQGLSKAKELAEEEGYEFCTPVSPLSRQEYPARENSRAVWTTQPIHIESSGGMSRNYTVSNLDRHNFNIPRSGQRFRPRSETEHQRTGGSDPSILGTSTPLDSGAADEYVIVTGPDHRLMLGCNHPVAAAVSSGNPTDETYEVMTSARAELVQQRVQQQSSFSTPDPSLYGNSSMTQFSGHSLSDEFSPSLPSRSGEEGVLSGKIEDSMSLSDLDGPPVYFNVHRKSSSLSASSRYSASSEEGGLGEKMSATVSGAVSEAIHMPAGRLGLVKTHGGSPLDISGSSQLK